MYTRQINSKTISCTNESPPRVSAFKKVPTFAASILTEGILSDQVGPGRINAGFRQSPFDARRLSERQAVSVELINDVLVI